MNNRVEYTLVETGCIQKNEDIVYSSRRRVVVKNAKQKIGNKELIPYMKEIVTEGLEKFFQKEQALLNDFIKIIKLNAKARLEATKAKTATQTERLNTFKEHNMSNYIRCNNTGRQWKEIN